MFRVKGFGVKGFGLQGLGGLQGHDRGAKRPQNASLYRPVRAPTQPTLLNPELTIVNLDPCWIQFYI